MSGLCVRRCTCRDEGVDTISTIAPPCPRSVLMLDCKRLGRKIKSIWLWIELSGEFCYQPRPFLLRMQSIGRGQPVALSELKKPQTSVIGLIEARGSTALVHCDQVSGPTLALTATCSSKTTVRANCIAVTNCKCNSFIAVTNPTNRSTNYQVQKARLGQRE